MGHAGNFSWDSCVQWRSQPRNECIWQWCWCMSVWLKIKKIIKIQVHLLNHILNRFIWMYFQAVDSEIYQWLRTQIRTPWLLSASLENVTFVSLNEGNLKNLFFLLLFTLLLFRFFLYLSIYLFNSSVYF